MDLIREIIDQQMALQPDVEYIHVGCDEVWALGSSNESQSLMNQFSMSKDTMFLQHVKQVLGKCFKGVIMRMIGRSPSRASHDTFASMSRLHKEQLPAGGGDDVGRHVPRHVCLRNREVWSQSAGHAGGMDVPPKHGC